MRTVRILAVAGLVVALGFVYNLPADAALSADDRDDIAATVLDYGEGWYAGDADRMRRALHPDLAKRIVRSGPEGSRLEAMTAEDLVGATGQGYGRNTPEADRQADVEILDVFGNIASVRLTMHGWVDYMHVARYDDRWVIVNVLWDVKS